MTPFTCLLDSTIYEGIGKVGLSLFSSIVSACDGVGEGEHMPQYSCGHWNQKTTLRNQFPLLPAHWSLGLNSDHQAFMANTFWPSKLLLIKINCIIKSQATFCQHCLTLGEFNDSSFMEIRNKKNCQIPADKIFFPPSF